MPANSGPGELNSYTSGFRPSATPDVDATDFTADQTATDESGLKGGATPIPDETAGMIQPRITRNVGRDGPGGTGIA